MSQIRDKCACSNAKIILVLTQNPKLKGEVRITIFSAISDAKNATMKEVKPVVGKGEASIKMGVEFSNARTEEKKKRRKKEEEERKCCYRKEDILTIIDPLPEKERVGGKMLIGRLRRRF